MMERLQGGPCWYAKLKGLFWLHQEENFKSYEVMAEDLQYYLAITNGPM